MTSLKGLNDNMECAVAHPDEFVLLEDRVDDEPIPLHPLTIPLPSGDTDADPDESLPLISSDEIIVIVEPPVDDSLSGYECAVCGIPHQEYFRQGEGLQENWKEADYRIKRSGMRLDYSIADEVVQCEQGFMMTRLSLIAYNAQKDDARVNDVYVHCPACETVHEGHYKTLVEGINGVDTMVQCPEGRIMPKQEIISYSRDRIEESIDKKTKEMARILPK